MTKPLKTFALAVGVRRELPMHSFRSGGAIVLEASQYHLEVHLFIAGGGARFGIARKY